MVPGLCPATPMQHPLFRRWTLGAAACLLAVLTLGAAAARATDAQPAQGEPIPPSSLQEFSRLRRSAGVAAEPVDVAARRLAYRGRPALEIVGRDRGGEAAGTLRDFAFFDLAAGRVVSYVSLANASTRRAGEAIISLSEISTHADRAAREIFPGANLALESIRRYRASGQESIYYEARYAPPPAEIPFLGPPIRLLLNASTGKLFRVDVDPEWLDPPPPPRSRISRQAAERIAAVSLRARDLATTFGAGAVLGKIGPAELFTVRPNDWLGYSADDPDARSRLAWVVPFRLAGGDAPGPHSLFVDAATGRVLGGLAEQAAADPAR